VEVLMPTAAALNVPKGFELIDGKLVEKAQIGALAAWILGRLFALVDDYCRCSKLGVVLLSEAPYQCFPTETVRKPRISVLRCDPDTFVPQRHNCPIAPDLAVEFIPSSGMNSDLIRKVDEFLRAGTQLVWVIDPDLCVVHVHRANGSVTTLREHEELTGEAVLPGFATPLAAFLPRRPAPQP
jgi:Uma2 family endonuclease